jgi:hypothetical protein
VGGSAIVVACILGKNGLVQLTKLKIVQYELDGAAHACNLIVVRLLLYNCQYNSIELVWTEVTYEVADKTFHLGFQLLKF